MQLPITVGTWILAFLPLAFLLFMMIVRRWGAAQAGPVAWILAALVATAAFQLSLRGVALQSVKGTWSALTILYVVWPAILIYEVTREADAFEPFRRGITRLLPHPLLQVMAFGWAFASFLQGITGFGVPIAVCAPLLVGIGVRPLYAVVIPLVGHAWNNTFGTLAVAWLGLEEVTDLSPAAAATTALYASAFIWILNIVGGLLVCWIYGRTRGIREGLPAVIPISLAHGGLTLVLSQWNDVLNGFIAGVVGFALIFALGRLPFYRRTPSLAGSRIFEPGVQETAQRAPAGDEAPGTLPETPAGPPAGTSAGTSAESGGRAPARPGAQHAPAAAPAGAGTSTAAAPAMSLNKAFIPYYALLAITLGVLLIGPVENALGAFSFGLSFPELSTGFGFVTPAEATEVSLFTHAGTFLFASAFVGYAAYASLGYIGKGGIGRIWSRTVEKAVASTIAIVALVAMASVMQGAGQAQVLAEGVATATGGFYGFLAPFVGTLGAFMTSSNLASNLLFGTFQQTTASAAGLDTSAILGAQTAGGALGNTVAPGNVLLGTTTAGILGREGDVLRITFPLALLIAAIIGLVVLFVA